MIKSRKTPIKRVLLVEDSPAQAVKLKDALEREDLLVTIKDDGPAAIEVASQDTFELIVLDVELPTMNGYDICRVLKNNPATADIPVIIMSARNHSLNTLTGSELGVVDYIPKGAFAEAILVHTIRYINQGKL